MLISPIVQQPYDFKAYNLLQLQSRILKDHDYSRMDIAKGYVQKTSYTLHYDFSDLDLTIPESAKEQFRKLHADSIKELAHILEDSYLNQVQEYSKFEQEIQKDLPAFTWEDLEKSADRYSVYTIQSYLQRKLNCNYDTARTLADKIMEFARSQEKHQILVPEKYKPYIDMNPSYSAAEDTVFEVILYCKMKDAGLTDRYQFNTSFRSSIQNDASGLPTRFDPQSPAHITERFVLSKVYDEITADDAYLPQGTPYQSFLPHILPIRSSDVNVRIFPIFPDAQKYYKKAVANAIGDVSLEDGVFAVMVDAMPVVVNKNSKTGKLELIDGYKRILVNNNPKQLDHSVAIKVFTDLSDTDFLKLIFALNEWKTATKEDVYDRGFMFALREHFNIRQEDYPEIQHRNNFSLFNLLHLYGEDSNSVPEQYANDILQMKDLKALYDSTESIKNETFKKMLFTHLVEELGKARREYPDSPKINVHETFENVVNDPKLVALLNKKANLQMSSYIDKYWTDMKVDDYLQSAITEAFDSCDKEAGIAK